MSMYLTIGQLERAMQANPYIVIRMASGFSHAANSGILKILSKKNYSKLQYTSYVSWYPCSFHEYISKKVPFKLNT